MLQQIQAIEKGLADAAMRAEIRQLHKAQIQFQQQLTRELSQLAARAGREGAQQLFSEQQPQQQQLTVPRQSRNLQLEEEQAAQPQEEG